MKGAVYNVEALMNLMKLQELNMITSSVRVNLSHVFEFANIQTVLAMECYAKSV